MTSCSFRDLAEYVVSSWPASSGLIRSFNPGIEAHGIPAPAIVAEICSVVFHAGLTREEGRPITLRVAFLPNQGLDPDTQSRYHAFSSSLPFTAAHVARLAPAVDVRYDVIAIRAEPDGQELSITGILRAFSTRKKRWSPVYDSQRQLPFLSATTFGPGHLLLSYYGRVLGLLTNGAIHAFSHDVLCEGALTPLSTHFAQSRWDLITESRRSSQVAMNLKFVVRTLYDHVLANLLNTTELFGHGGAFIMMRDSASIADASSGMRVKYSFHMDSCWKSMIATFQDSDDPIDNVRAVEDLWESVAMIARLANVDGAVLLTDHFRVLGFGVEICDAPDPPEIFVCNSPDYVLSDGSWKRPPLTYTKGNPLDYGMRHRSAFRLVHRFPHLLVFVVSQDMNTKAVTHTDGRVVLWPNCVPNYELLRTG